MSLDMEGITGSLLLCMLCLISSTYGAENSSPVITIGRYRVCEDAPIGTSVFTITATDPDNDPLIYKIVGVNAHYFRVDESNGEVFIAEELDRETLGAIQLTVAVSDGQNEAKADPIISIEDANDRVPQFQPPSYDYSCPENKAPGTLFKVSATDGDTSSAGSIRYNIDEVVPEAGKSLFTINSATGAVDLTGSLNYTALSTFYQLKINASDRGGKCFYDDIVFQSSTAFAIITVVDVADLDPKFVGTPYSASVKEHSPVDTSVFKVSALDEDKGVNDAILYSIEDSTEAGLFKISRNDGVISVLSDIDRETVGDTVTLTIKATESKPNIYGNEASALTTVQITILDINDKAPEFYKCENIDDDSTCVIAHQFTGEVVENSLGSISINMKVKDLDRTTRIELSLEGTDKDVFSVAPQSTTLNSVVQLQVRQPEKLDFEEKQEMVVQIIAVDEEDTSFRSTATVTITIKDDNDNNPMFPKSLYQLEVPEHSAVGTVIATVTADDPDTMDQGKITYKLLPDSIRQYFDVKPETGEIYVNNSDLLDRESRSEYSANLQARDSGGRLGSTELMITLTDINDRAPVINRESYQVFVPEDGRVDVKIEASDADEPGTVNSQIVYEINPSEYSDNFTINPTTGVLTNKVPLNREALDPVLNGRIELNVTARDSGAPPLSTWVTVIINVEDVNDNKPEFESPSYTFSVKEGDKGAHVGSVYAKDLDQTAEFNRISFSILDGSFGSFIIRSSADGDRGYKGDIFVDPDIELNYESNRKHFSLQVEATDLSEETAKVKVDVNVLDVNDERPSFKPMDSVKVKENTTITEIIGRFEGVDVDGNHSLIYELESIKCRCNGSLTPCDNFVLDPSGEVRVNSKHKLDYEQCDQVVISAQVVDEFTEKGENNSATTGVMVIDIEDINDNVPEFILSDTPFVVVSESASAGVSVASVTATDLDSGKNGEIAFAVVEVKFEDLNNQVSGQRPLFTAITTAAESLYFGTIQAAEPLDVKAKGKYLVTVTATDSGGLSTSTVLDIFTIDESYRVELEFTKSEEQVQTDINEITRQLTSATQAVVHIVRIRPEDPSSEARATGNTIIEAYFIYKNGTALPTVDVETKLSDPEHFLALGQLGLQNIGTTPVSEPKVNPLMYGLAGMVAGLIIMLTILTTSLMCTRRNYRRKLKAAKAMNSASMVTYDNQKSGPVVPGTNKYTMEGANPVLNLNIDTTMVLDMDEESSDVDKVSLNSLDYEMDMSAPDKEKKNGMLMIEEEEDDYDDRPPEYIEPLGAALAQRGQKKGSDKLNVGFTNPAFSTTDL